MTTFIIFAVTHSVFITVYMDSASSCVVSGGSRNSDCRGRRHWPVSLPFLSYRPVASLLIPRGVVFLRFSIFSGFENWSSQWLAKGILKWWWLMTLLCGQSSNTHSKSILDFINFISHTDNIQDVSARTVGGKWPFIAGRGLSDRSDPPWIWAWAESFQETIWPFWEP